MPDKMLTPCWDPSNVRRAISSAGIALLAADDRPYFLATHAPITRIWDERAHRRIDEVMFFKNVMMATGEVMAAVHGAPGTGKSHLIHWLKLRTDDALTEGTLQDVRTVLIQRSTGTLKDALTQMLQQLGGSFERHLEPVRQALEKISDHSAREKLLLALSLEVGSLRQDRGKPPLPRSLRGLAEACRSEGFGRWLCRPGGAIDLNIRRLTEPAGPDGAAEMAEFTAKDLNPPPEYRDSRHIAEAVRALLDELDDVEELRTKAAAEMNDALRHAIQEVTGLGGNRLRQVFDDVRRELKAQGQVLAVFIEDVSAMGELDTEVINAVEPQPRPELCRMIAVLGLTEAGFARLRDNVRQRLTHVYAVGSTDSGDWRDDPEETAKFAARYLNAIRLDEPCVRRIAEQRRTIEDVTESKCTTCPQVRLCHEVFGKATINGIDIGMFPFTQVAPHRLLSNLATDRPGIQRTPRGLLAQAMVPVLSDGGRYVDLNSLPPTTLPVNIQSFDYWTAVIQQYCSGMGWTDEQKQRLRVLAGLWFDLPSSAEPETIVAALQPILEHLGFAKFNKRVGPIQPKPTPTPPPQTPAPQTPPTPPTPPASSKLTGFLDRLNRWKAGEKFHKDEEPRRLLAGLIRRGVAWDEARVPVAVWRNLIADVQKSEKYEYVRIDGQTSNPTTAFVLEFPRDDATYHVLEALAQFEYAGNKSWDFKYGPMYQRHAGRWLRANQPMIVERLKAAGDLDPAAPVATAVRFLAAVAMVRRRGKLPEKRDELVREILANVWDDAGKPVVLSSDFQALVADMRARHLSVRTFLLAELNVPQGLTGGQNFIDPRPILEHAEAFAKDLAAGPVSDEYFTSYWKSRFAAMQKMGAYASLPSTMASERQALASLLGRIEQFLEKSGIDPADAVVAVGMYCKAVGDVMAAKKETRLTAQPDSIFDPLWLRRTYAESAEVWGRAVRRGREVVAGGGDLDVLLFDPTRVMEADDNIAAADGYFRSLKEHLDGIEAALFPGEGESEMEKELLETLTAIGGADGTPVVQPATGELLASDQEEGVEDDGNDNDDRG